MTVVSCNCRIEAADSVAQTSSESCKASREVCARACKPTADHACCARSRFFHGATCQFGVQTCRPFWLPDLFKCKSPLHLTSRARFKAPVNPRHVTTPKRCQRCSQHLSALQHCRTALPCVSMRPVNPNYDWHLSREGRGLPTQVRRRAKRAARPKRPPHVVPARAPAP